MFTIHLYIFSLSLLKCLKFVLNERECRKSRASGCWRTFSREISVHSPLNKKPRFFHWSSLKLLHLGCLDWKTQQLHLDLLFLSWLVPFYFTNIVGRDFFRYLRTMQRRCDLLLSLPHKSNITPKLLKLWCYIHI